MTGDSLSSETNIEESLQSIIEAEGLTGNPEIKIKPGCDVGDGFIGINNIVDITSENKSVSLFVKGAPKSKKLRETPAWLKGFINEIYFYEKVYPTFLKFQTERAVTKPFVSVAKCYATSAEDFNEYLIFENLKNQGYTMCDRKTQVNDEHVVFVLETYAKYHAVSYAMKDQDCGLYESLTANLCDAMSEWAEEAGMAGIVTSSCNASKILFNPVADEYIVSKYETMADNLTDALLKAKEYIDEYSVITHGDCWCNNMMFLYKDSEQQHPIDVKLLDWQLLRVNTPVLDLSYFFYSVASKEMMGNLDYYLKLYHNSLSEHIRVLGSDPEKLYPYAIFREHWRKYSRYGLTMAFIIIKIMLTDKDEVPNIEKSAEDYEKIADAFHKKIRNSDVYDARIKAVIEHFVINKFI